MIGERYASWRAKSLNISITEMRKSRAGPDPGRSRIHPRLLQVPQHVQRAVEPKLPAFLHQIGNIQAAAG